MLAIYDRRARDFMLLGFVVSEEPLEVIICNRYSKSNDCFRPIKKSYVIK